MIWFLNLINIFWLWFDFCGFAFDWTGSIIFVCLFVFFVRWRVALPLLFFYNNSRRHNILWYTLYYRGDDRCTADDNLWVFLLIRLCIISVRLTSLFLFHFISLRLLWTVDELLASTKIAPRNIVISHTTTSSSSSPSSSSSSPSPSSPPGPRVLTCLLRR